MMKYLFSICLAVIVCFGCYGQPKLVKTEDVTFKLGFVPTAAPQCFVDGNEEYMAFANLSSNKEIALFKPDGTRVATIHTDSLAMKTRSDYVGFFFACRDTVLVLSKYSNLLAILNGNSDILNVLNYQELLAHDEMELSVPLFYNNGQIRIGAMFGGNNWKTPEECRQGWSRYPRLMAYRIAGDEAPSLQVRNFYDQFAKPTDDISEGNRMLLMEDKSIIWSMYCDTLYVYDLDGKLQQKAAVESDYIKTKLTPASIYDTWADQQLGNRITQEGSYIDKLCFDKYRGVYYCFIQDKVSEGRQDFYLIIFNDNLEKIGEIPFVDGEYYSYPIVGKKGLYLLKQRNKSGFRAQAYTIFRYER